MKDTIINAIKSAIKTNNSQAITGQVLQNVLVDIVNDYYAEIPPIYTGLGSAMDGAINQKATTDAINAVDKILMFDGFVDSAQINMSVDPYIGGQIIFVKNSKHFAYYRNSAYAANWDTPESTSIKYQKIVQGTGLVPNSNALFIHGTSIYRWNGSDLVSFIDVDKIRNEKGSSATDLMSQKAITDAIGEVIPEFSIIDSQISIIASTYLNTDGTVVYSTVNKTFAYKVGAQYYSTWPSVYNYLNAGTLTPIQNKLFTCNKKHYLFNGTDLVLLSNESNNSGSDSSGDSSNINLDGYLYISAATPSTTPITLTGNEKVFYIATEEGNYTNFGLGNISDLSIIKSVLGSWTVEGLGVRKMVKKPFLKNIPFTTVDRYYALNSAAVGQTLVKTENSASGYSYIEFSCQEGDTFYITTVGNTSAAKSYAITGDNDVVIALGSSVSLSDVELTIPSGGKKLIVNSKKEGGSVDKLLTIPDVSIKNNTIYIGDESIEVINAVTDLTKYFVQKYYINVAAVVGEKIKYTLNKIDSYSFAIIPTLEGEIYKIKVPDGGTSSAPIICVTNNLGICTYISATSSFDDKIEIQESGFLIINTKNISSCIIEKEGPMPMVTQDLEYSKGNAYINLNGISPGSYANILEVISQAGYCYSLIRVHQGQQYQISTSGNSQYAKSCVLLDSNMKCYHVAPDNLSNYLVTVLEDGYMVCGSKTAGFSISILSRIELDCCYNTIIAEHIDAKNYKVSEYNNVAHFDNAAIGDLNVCALYLDYNRNIPTKGAVISRDITGKSLDLDSASLSEIQSIIVPYLFFNQKKVGTIVLFDEETERPFIFDSNNNKKYLKYE